MSPADRRLLARCALPLMLASTATAQLVEKWSVTDSTASCHAIAVDPAGRCAVAGGSASGSDPVAVIVLRDAMGATSWQRVLDFGTMTNEYFGYVVFAPNGDLVVLGSVISSPSAPFLSDVLLARYDIAGSLLWARQISSASTGVETGGAPVLAPNGDILFAGTSPTVMGGQDLAVWRCDSSGNVLWVARADGAAHVADSAHSLAIAPSGDVYACGVANSTPPSRSDAFLVRVSAGGTVVWAREDSIGSGHQGSESIAIDPAGRIFVAGWTPVGDSFDAVFRRYDASNALLWSQQSGASWANGLSVEVDPWGDVLFLALTRDAALVQGYSVHKYAIDGTPLWTRSRDASRPLGFVVDGGGDVYVHGENYAPYPYTDAMIVRHDRSGDVRWAYVDGLPGPAGTEGVYGLRVGTEGVLHTVYADAFRTVARRYDRSARAICFGDGSGSACPCGNASAAADRAGCSNSLGGAGRLDDAGVASLAADSLRLDAAGLSGTSALFLQGDASEANGAGTVFGDGLRCAGGNIVRLATKSVLNGRARYPEAGDAPISARGGLTAPGERVYQAWYRNAASFCTAATFNQTNGLLAIWQP